MYLNLFDLASIDLIILTLAESYTVSSRTNPENTHLPCADFLLDSFK